MVKVVNPDGVVCEPLFNPLNPPFLGEFEVGGYPQTPGRRYPAPFFNPLFPPPSSEGLAEGPSLEGLLCTPLLENVLIVGT